MEVYQLRSKVYAQLSDLDKLCEARRPWVECGNDALQFDEAIDECFNRFLDTVSEFATQFKSRQETFRSETAVPELDM